MAINIPIITEFADAGLKSARGAFDQFKLKVGEADGAMGKFKAAGNVAFDTIKANAGVMALGAGAAIAGFALKAISQFQDLALEVDKFSNATGLAAEESSKWIEVAGDIGIESGTLLTAFNRMNKAIGDNSKAFQDLGVEIVRTSSGATDVNATFLNTVEALRKIQDPAQRARLATQILGRSWTELSELVEMGAGSLKSALDDVAGAKVIDEQEIQKAKDLRAAQDALGDAFDEFVLMVGEELIPAFTNATKASAGLLEVIGPLTKAVLGQVEADASYGEQISQNNVSLRIAATAWEWLAKKLGMASDETEENAEVTAEMTAAWRDGYRAMIDGRMASEGLTIALMDVDEALSELKGNVDDRQAWRNLQDEFDRTLEMAIRAFSEGTPEALRDSEAALDRTRLKVGEYIAELESIPEDQKTEIIASLNNANIQQIEEILNNLARTRQTSIIAEALGATPVTPNPWQPGQVPFAPVRPAAARMGTNVNVNVAGSVIAENDLVETVRKGLVNAQRSGAGLVYTNR